MEPIGGIDGLVIADADTARLAAFRGDPFATTVASNENDGHYIDLHPTTDGLMLRFQRVPEAMGWRSVIIADPEGNEACLIHPDGTP